MSVKCCSCRRYETKFKSSPQVQGFSLSDNKCHQTIVFRCNVCNFATTSQAGLSVHRTKKHAPNDTVAKSVSVVRSYPEGKKFYCCLCQNIIVNFPNFKRHFQVAHPTTLLTATGHCSICNRDFPNAQSVSVHCRRQHGISKKKSSNSRNHTVSPSPIKGHVKSVLRIFCAHLVLFTLPNIILT